MPYVFTTSRIGSASALVNGQIAIAHASADRCALVGK